MEQPIDVRAISPRFRHPTIFRMWNELPTGSALLLINDHDPAPLYHQFAAEYPGHFYWEYVLKGPRDWRVRITKGSFADAGFVPAKKKTGSRTASISFVESLILDTRPIFARGATPCDQIDEAVEKLIPGQPFILIAPFQPVPLYAKLRKEGFSHVASQLEDGSWRIEFRKK